MPNSRQATLGVGGPDPRYLIIADGFFNPLESKTANSVIRYHPERVVAVFDRRTAGRTVQEVLGFGGAIPVVGSFEEGLRLNPTVVMIGIAPLGGRLPVEWQQWLLEGLRSGCDLLSGLHTFLSDVPALATAARENGRKIVDARKPPANLPVASGRAREVDPFVVLAVGTDCNVGKMTTQLELTRALRAKGLRATFVPTGQTGIFIEGWGTAVDAVVADFIAGAAEDLVLTASRDSDLVLVEGQGSINHPGYSAVTLGLLHGSCPDAMILCHQATRRALARLPMEIPPLLTYVEWYQSLASAVHPSKVLGIALNTYDLDDEAARRACEKAETETGLPCTDPVRFGTEPLVQTLTTARAEYLNGKKPR